MLWKVKQVILTCWADTGADEIPVGQCRTGVGAARGKGWPLLHINQVSWTGWLLWNHPQQQSRIIQWNICGTSTQSTHYMMLCPSSSSRHSCCSDTAASLLWRRHTGCTCLLHRCICFGHRAGYNDWSWDADSPERWKKINCKPTERWHEHEELRCMVRKDKKTYIVIFFHCDG